ncbi:MAG TPA: S1C family serine protease [Acidimicrobiia bacterium]|nr:S1C family serine protease [Acidimicrobiia bacterium]
MAVPVAVAAVSALLTAGVVMLALDRDPADDLATVLPTALRPAGVGGQEIPAPVLEVVAWDGPKPRYGSAVVYGSDGVVVTSAAVVHGAASIELRTADAEIRAEVVGVDVETDVAVLRVPTRLLGAPAFSRLASAAGTHSGEPCQVVAMEARSGGVRVIGGRVAGTGVAVPLDDTWLVDAIEFEAATGASAAGGALLDADGRLVGIVTSARSERGGRPLAVPAATVARSVEAILGGGDVTHAWLGIGARDEPSAGGAVVVSVAEDSPAGRAGIQPGDIVTAVGDDPIPDTGALMRAVRSRAPGERVRIVVRRAEAELELTARLDGR